MLVGHGRAPELELGRMLQEYTTLMRPKKGRGQLVFINLQKRLLSSIEAFTRTLRLHEKSVGEGKAHTTLQLTLDEAATTTSTASTTRRSRTPRPPRSSPARPRSAAPKAGPSSS